jgi:hypothetical protein
MGIEKEFEALSCYVFKCKYIQFETMSDVQRYRGVFLVGKRPCFC